MRATTSTPPFYPPQHDVLLDASLLLHPRAFEIVARDVDEARPSDRIFVPQVLLDVVREAAETGPELFYRLDAVLRPWWPGGYRQTGRGVERSGFPEHPPVGEPSQLRWRRLDAWLSSRASPYIPSDRDLALLEEGGGAGIAESLRARHGDLVGEILAQEWIFLQTHSWIASRTRWTFTQFIKAGGVALEAGRESYWNAVQRAERELPQLATRHGAKRAIRWVGTTTAAWTVHRTVPGSDLIDALLGAGMGTAGGAAANAVQKRLFVLIDP